MGGPTTAEKNRRKRERKKKEREEERKRKEEEEKNEKDAAAAAADADEEGKDDSNMEDIEIEYVAEPLEVPDEEAFDAVRRFQELSVVVTDDDNNNAAAGQQNEHDENDDNYGGRSDEDEDDDHAAVSKKKLREMLRPSIGELKRRVKRPDLVEAHDVTATDPEFLIQLKAVPGSVPVPRHWGRKRKYLQGKRGYEKPMFELPDFIVKTGITEVRDTVAKDESEMSAKQKNRMRVAPKMGAIDVDYKTLHDAFFKHQTKPSNLTKFGDIYYEGKELEVQTNIKPGGPLSDQLRDALGMTSDTSPPPWLLNMQRYGPPPSYATMKIPGLNAPLPSPECQYGYHPGGWGKPPLDPYGRPLYGGNPFDPPGSGGNNNADADRDGRMVTSDGKTVSKSSWGALPEGDIEEEEEEEEESEEEESSGSEMEESEEEEGTEMPAPPEGIESVLPLPPVASTAPVDLRKQAGDETPMPAPGEQPKQLYQVIEQKQADRQSGAVFSSEVAYVVPGAAKAAAPVPEGAESVLSKALPQNESSRRKKKDNEDDDGDLGKNFKF